MIDIQKQTDTESEVEITSEVANTTEEKLISIFKNFLANGYSSKETIENVSRIYKIDKHQMLEMMQSYLINNGKVKSDESGRIYRTEKEI